MGKRTDDFTRLVRGDVVTIEGLGVAVGGTVEEVSPDGSVLWIREHGGHGRHMVHKTDSMVVRRAELALNPGQGELRDAGQGHGD